MHTTVLKPYGRRDKPQDMREDEEEIWEGEEIVNSRTVKGVVQYRMQWTGCTELVDTWETFAHLDNCSEKPQEFRKKFPTKPRDEIDVGPLPNIWISNHVHMVPFISSYCRLFPLAFLAS